MPKNNKKNLSDSEWSSKSHYNWYSYAIPSVLPRIQPSAVHPVCHWSRDGPELLFTLSEAGECDRLDSARSLDGPDWTQLPPPPPPDGPNQADRTGAVCPPSVYTAAGQRRYTVSDPVYMSRKIRKFRTDKFDTRNKRKF